MLTVYEIKQSRTILFTNVTRMNPPLARLIKKSFNRRKAQNSAMFHGSWKLTFRALYNGIAYGIFGRVE
jgi:hypothetical protein